ncbi:hypothetical protein [Paenibacillus sp. QZ-Y1]|uniref:hypothetical protein n=1 Tax=Paenibacillus sp. QZ-Y1 TaxID=3414511 RepID=UPI003F791593
MIIDRLQAFLAQPTKFNGSVNIYSPTMDEISNVGYEEYMLKVQFSLFNKEKILIDLFNLSDEDYDLIKETSDYDILTDHPNLKDYMTDSLSFFARSPVIFDELSNSFKVDGVEFVNKDNYQDYSLVIKQLNAMDMGSEQETKKTAKAKAFQDRINFFKKKTQKKEDVLEIKDILSILCNAGNNGINIFNVGSLTIYQVYEQFERLNIKESFNRLHPVWANGHLGENTKLPEWIKRTKL